ncbi:MAG: T9SS type A sorting domain-containing protein, partial [Flavobacteriales bacterium]
SRPPAWDAELLGSHSARIGSSRTMLAESDGTPILVAADSMALGPLGVSQRPIERITVLPNPTADGTIEIRHRPADVVEVLAVYAADGRGVAVRPERRAGGWRLDLPVAVGVYFVHLRVNGAAVLQRVVRQ